MINYKISRKALLTELLWLMGIFILTIIARYVLLQLEMGNGALDINLHDTYVVVIPRSYYAADFVLVGFIIYAVRAIAALYKTPLLNILLMSFNLLLIFFSISLCFQSLAFIKPNLTGWTVYPPLSALPKAQPPIFNYLLVFKVFVVSEIVLIMHLCFVSIRVGLSLKQAN